MSRASAMRLPEAAPLDRALSPINSPLTTPGRRDQGIAYPVSICQAIDLYDELGEDRHVIHEDHPSIKIALDLDALSFEQRQQAVLLLQRALDRLVAAGSDVPRPPGGGAFDAVACPRWI